MSFSLPTTFTSLIKDNTIENFKDINKIRIEKAGEKFNFEYSGDVREIVIEEKDDIKSLLNNDVPIYYGGRYGGRSEEEYSLFIYFDEKESPHRYTIANKYIMASDIGKVSDSKTYKVLDNHNKVFDDIEYIFSE